MQLEALKLVFSDRRYIILSIIIFAVLLVLLSIISEFIFLSPVLIFYIPTNAIVNFSLIVIIGALSGVVISLSIFRMRLVNNGIRKSGTGFLGSIIGVGSGACSCSPIGFSIVSIFGTLGGTVTAFLTNYEIPLRLVSIAILCSTYYVSVKEITRQCKITK